MSPAYRTFGPTIALSIWIWVVGSITSIDAKLAERMDLSRKPAIIIEDIKFASYRVLDVNPGVNGSFEIVSYKDVYGMMVDVEVGTPPQEVTLRLSGGSSTWIPRDINFGAPGGFNTSQRCRRVCSLIESYGGYIQNRSVTWEKVRGLLKPEEHVSLSHPIDSYEGQYLSDTFFWGDQSEKSPSQAYPYTIDDFLFLAADEFNSTGELGLGLLDFTGELGGFGGKEFLRRIVERYSTSGSLVMGFSVYYDAYDINSSEITFSTIDINKYQLPMVTYTWPPQRLVTGGGIMTASVGFSMNGTLKTVLNNQPTIISLGQPTIGLPAQLLNTILKSVNAVESKVKDGLWSIECGKIKDVDLSLDIRFEGLNITLTAEDFMVKVPKPSNVVQEEGEGEENEDCRIFLESSEQNDDYGVATVYLGIPFLRKAYVWTDYQNNQTSIAKSKQRVTNSTLVPISSAGIFYTFGDQRYGSPDEEVRPLFGPSDYGPISTISDFSFDKPSMKMIIGATIAGAAVLTAVGVLVLVVLLGGRPEVPQVPPVPELGGAERCELNADHGWSEVVGSQGGKFQGSDDEEN
ncbi:hypothetical protein TWF679_002316 [Orbilia oligospora]|uniref:Peptidase A1 domain-containing protein n=1 Tax=Orbilia oligospora TaxID=2813651 RepID=A0A8H8VGH3_ORBOL|nr:hypothetical protein TWF679_002316 [Orbilia oligospora]